MNFFKTAPDAKPRRIKLLVRRFSPAQGPDQPSELHSTYSESNLDIDSGKTAFIILDAWSNHPTVDFQRRANENIKEFLFPALETARKAKIRIVHASFGNPISPLITILPGEKNCEPSITSAQFKDWLHENGIETLIYCGYASNWCLINRPIGICAMSALGFKVILLRDASLGYETPDSYNGEWAHHIAINIIESQFGYSTDCAAFEVAVSSTGPTHVQETQTTPSAHWKKEPFFTLREKWHLIPTGVDTGEISSRELVQWPNEKLLQFWDTSKMRNLEKSGFAVRGWYHELYDEFLSRRKIMDIGCGLGIDSVHLLEKGARVTFCDLEQANLDVVRRIVKLKGLEKNAEFLLIENFNSFNRLPSDYDAVLAIGSLHHCPQTILKQESAEIIKLLKPGARWLQLAYPKTRWKNEGALPFDQWGQKTNSGTPWTEWYDTEKLLNVLKPAQFELVFYTEFHNHEFNWFDLRYRPSV